MHHTPALTLVDHVSSRISPLCDALGLDAPQVVETFRELVSPWAAAPADASGWPSEIADDNTPIELSVALERDAAALRVLFEPQAQESTLAGLREAGLAFHDRLEARYDADLSRFNRLRDVFLPADMQGRFAAWSSVVFARGERPSFKSYLNPNAQGAALAPALVEEALARLDLRHAGANLREAATQRGPFLDELKYFALDLTRHAHARVKVYVHHHGATASDLEAACAASRNHASGEVLAFARAMCRGDEPMRARAPFTCHAFTSERPDRATTTVYVPVCAYAHDDAEAYRRVVAWLEERGMDPTPYRRVVLDAAARSLDAGVGLQSWIALRNDGDHPRLTVYLATEARHVHPPGTIPAPSPDPLRLDVEEDAIRLLDRRPLTLHPFVRRLEGEPRLAVLLLVRALHEALAPPQEASGSFTGLTALDGLANAYLRPTDERSEPGRRARERLLGLRARGGDEARGALLAADRAAGQLAERAAHLLLGGDAERAPVPTRPHENSEAFTRGVAGAHATIWRLLDELDARVPAEVS
ncbi:MAG: tryptophan dimethylallyltransferase family protein [Myxococcota bacterium]